MHDESVTTTLMRLRQLRQAAADVMFPRACAGCGAWDEDVCEPCSRAFCRDWVDVASRAPYLVRVQPFTGECVSDFPCFALAAYEGRMRDVIVTWKHSNVRALDRRITSLWRDAVQRLLGTESFITARRVVGPAPICVVPAPSRWHRRHKGQLVAHKLAVGLCEESGWPVADVLRTTASTGAAWPATGLAWPAVDQFWERGSNHLWDCVSDRLSDQERIGVRGMPDSWSLMARVRTALRSAGAPRWMVRRGYQVANFSERGDKRAGIYSVEDMSGKGVVIVDDVVTTGATASGVEAAIARAGGKVIAVVALAAPARIGGARAKMDDVTFGSRHQ